MNQIQYYIDLICQKLDLQLDSEIMNIEAIYTRDWNSVEFLNQMMLKPRKHLISEIEQRGKGGD